LETFRYLCEHSYNCGALSEATKWLSLREQLLICGAAKVEM